MSMPNVGKEMWIDRGCDCKVSERATDFLNMERRTTMILCDNKKLKLILE